MATYDPRTTPARPDLAARQLEGQVAAARFVEGTACEVIEPQAPVRRAPSPDAELATEVLRGERVTVYETTDEGWCWGQLDTDAYVGWLPAGTLRAPVRAPTHKVAVLRTLVFPGPSIKLPPREFLSFGCRLAVERHDGDFAVTSAGYVPVRHLVSLEGREDDFVAVAERFLGVPYLWGGKSSLGIDCSGLVQVALTSAGIACPRDSDMQETALGRLINPGRDGDGLTRGDLLFWTGHVAIVRDGVSLVHANAWHMAVAIEPTAEALRRIEAAGIPLSCARRLG